MSPFTRTNNNSQPEASRFRQWTASSRRAAIACAIALTALVAALPLGWRGNAASGTIAGMVFQDYNANGARDAGTTISNNGQGTVGLSNDRGIQGVTVTAFDASGAAMGSAVTDAQGGYTLAATGTGPYRVEFSNLPAGFQPGPHLANSPISGGGTSVQFVADGNTSNVNLSLIIPQEYCQDNPTLATSCYVFGGQTTPDAAIVSFPYSAGTARITGPVPFTDFDAPGPGLVARANQVGTTWGLAYARTSKSLYSAAFMKKHAGFGSAGTGAIYKTDRNTNATSVYADLNTLLGANAAGANPHDANDFDRDNGNAAWAAVGKTALGGMAVSEDETKLYAMNLASRQLIELPLNAAPAAANIRTAAVPTNAPSCANPNDVRPFAVAWYQSKLYVGMVCSAESTVSDSNPTGDQAQLQAYVYTVDPASLAFSAAPVFQMPLNYSRRCADSAQLGPGNCFSAAWRGWSPVYRNIGTEGRAILPQPVLTGIGFDNGNLVLGLRDRSGDQFGNETLDNPADSNRYYGVPAGDVIRACGSPASGWTPESNGRCGGAGIAPQGTNQGPGGGEFYFYDNSDPFTDEVSLGGVLAMPGRPDLTLTVFDPIPVFEGSSLFDGGIRWLSNSTGNYAKSFRVYDGARAASGPLGKANGLGDLEALCDPAPVEIGNRIWRDLDGDGIQDANEPGIAGVTVALCAPDGSTIATAVTDANGNYYFSSAAGSGTAGAIYGLAGITPNTQGYKLKLNNPANFQAGGPLAAHNLSPADAGGQDQRDSDAMLMNGSPAITVNTGTAGANNHSFDFGFVPQGQPPTIACPTQPVSVNATGPTVVTYPLPQATPSTATVSCAPPSGSTFPLGTTTVTCTATSGALSTTCGFNVVVGPNPPTIQCPTQPVTVAATSPAGAVVTYPLPPATPATATVSCTPASGSTFPPGTTTVNCTATNGTLTAACGFQVIVNPLTQGADLSVTKTDNQTSYTPGQLLVYSIAVTNNGPLNVDNAVVVDVMPIALQNVNWTCQITAQGAGAGTSACGRPNGTGDINTTVSLKAGAVATYTVRARVSDNASGNLVNTVRVTNPPGTPDPTPGNNSATDTDTKSNSNPPPPSPVGPGDPLPGWSVLIYPVYTSNPANTASENTRISLTNFSTSQNACVHMFFVDGASCAVADAYVCLTPNQTTSFMMSDIDPGTMGYIIAVAVDCETGCPVKFNNLLGEEYVKFANGFSGNLKAECVTAINPPACASNASTAALNFDGVEFSQVPRVLALDSIASAGDGNSTLLVLDRIGGNLATGVGTLGSIFGLLYDDAETPFSFSFSAGSCQVKQTLSNNFPRTAPRFDTVIPSGRTGWMKLWPAAELGVVGAMFNTNPNAASNSSSYNGGHGLHALRLQAAASFTIPVFPPNC